MKDYYSILGIDKNATIQEIKKAYRSISIKNHPDKNSGNREIFQEADMACKVLSDSEVREIYDLYNNQGNHGFFVDNYRFGIGELKKKLGISRNYYEVLNLEKGISDEHVKAAVKGKRDAISMQVDILKKQIKEAREIIAGNGDKNKYGELLGVSEDSNREQVKEVAIKRIEQNISKIKELKVEYKEVKKAGKVLADEKSRRKYDKTMYNKLSDFSNKVNIQNNNNNSRKATARENNSNKSDITQNINKERDKKSEKNVEYAIKKVGKVVKGKIRELIYRDKYNVQDAFNKKAKDDAVENTKEKVENKENIRSDSIKGIGEKVTERKGFSQKISEERLDNDKLIGK